MKPSLQTQDSLHQQHSGASLLSRLTDPLDIDTLRHKWNHDSLLHHLNLTDDMECVQNSGLTLSRKWMNLSKTLGKERHPRWSPYTRSYKSSNRQRLVSLLEEQHWNSTQPTLTSSTTNINWLDNKDNMRREQQLLEMDRSTDQSMTNNTELNPDKMKLNGFYEPYERNWSRNEKGEVSQSHPAQQMGQRMNEVRERATGGRESISPSSHGMQQKWKRREERLMRTERR